MSLPSQFAKKIFKGISKKIEHVKHPKIPYIRKSIHKADPPKQIISTKEQIRKDNEYWDRVEYNQKYFSEY
jgi:hypothetical protein